MNNGGTTRPRSYIAIRFDVEERDADLWSDALTDAGALSVDVSDARAGTGNETPIYAEPGAAGGALWPICRIDALFDEGVDPQPVLRDAARAIGREAPLAESIAVPEQDWVRATQAQFTPTRIADGFWIVPTWHVPPDPTAVNLRLDPGVAFGTGSHPTTRLCLEWLRDNVGARASVLDYGCGSGILAIASAKLGAGRVIGVDVDAQALAASAANAAANGVVASFVEPGALRAETFDIVVANILTNTLRALAPALAMRVRDRGRIALAGILDTQAANVVAVYERWFNIAAWRACGGWTLLAGVRRPRSKTDPER